MPTDVIHSIGTSGRDYSTLQSWEDACPADLTAVDQRWIGECYNDSEFTAILTIGGQTVDSTRYVLLRCAAGQSFKDNANVATNALRYNQTNGVGIKVTTTFDDGIFASTQYTRLEGLQILGANDYTTPVRIGQDCRVDSCVLQCAASNEPLILSGVGNGVVINSVLILNSTFNAAIQASFGFSAYGCTFVRPSNRTATGYVLSVNYGTALAKNCALFGFTGYNTGNAATTGTDWNASDLASLPGSNNQTSLTYASQFEQSDNSGSAMDFRAKLSGDLKHGTPDATNTPVDIRNLTRDATTPWIGAWEISGVITRSQSAYRWRNDDGSESTASWKAAANVASTCVQLTPVRLRTQVDVANDAPSEALKLQYRRVGLAAADWRDVRLP